MNLHAKKSSFSSILYLFTTGDKILVVAIILIGIFSIFALNKYQQPGQTVSIKVSGQIKHRLKLNQDREILVTGPIGKTVIQIKDKKITVIHSDCPEKICVKTGAIHRAGEIIVCVPNKVVISIEGEVNNHFDVITQ